MLIGDKIDPGKGTHASPIAVQRHEGDYGPWPAPSLTNGPVRTAVRDAEFDRVKAE
jgi:hypothetical protein